MQNDDMKQRPRRVMVVDDTPENLRLIESMLNEKGYQVFALPSGDLALKAAKKNPPDLILLDVMMPGMDGFEVCAKLKADPKLADVPVIFLSALSETADKVKAFHSGGVDYITKPFQFEEVDARVTTHLNLRSLQELLEAHNLRLQELVDAQVKEISDSQMATIFALAKLAESRDYETGAHLERVQAYCRALAEGLLDESVYGKQISFDFISTLYQACPLHDIGKVAIPDNILLKPGKLTSDEFEVIKTHTTVGADTLLAVLKHYPKNALVNMGIDIARSHHERWNGHGYPDRLSGDAIPLSARIMALADVYDALRSIRTYKKAWDHETTKNIILEGKGTQFDPNVSAVFARLNKVFEDIHGKYA
jgi:putative two-component system response regulator